VLVTAAQFHLTKTCISYWQDQLTRFSRFSIHGMTVTSFCPHYYNAAMLEAYYVSSAAS